MTNPPRECLPQEKQSRRFPRPFLSPRSGWLVCFWHRCRLLIGKRKELVTRIRFAPIIWWTICENLRLGKHLRYALTFRSTRTYWHRDQTDKSVTEQLPNPRHISRVL